MASPQRPVEPLPNQPQGPLRSDSKDSWQLSLVWVSPNRAGDSKSNRMGFLGLAVSSVLSGNEDTFLARRRYKRAGERHKIYPNLLEDDFSAKTSFEKVCTDTTIIKHRGLSYDWTIYLDLFNKEIIAYDLRLSQSGHGIKNHMGALTRFLEAKQQRGYKEMTTMLHSDQGSIYTSRVFNARLDHTIRRSMSRVATPRDNPVLEAMNGWFKDELRFDFQLRDAQDIHKAIHEYIKYFNQVRLAYALNYKSPVHYRTGLI